MIMPLDIDLSSLHTLIPGHIDAQTIQNAYDDLSLELGQDAKISPLTIAKHVIAQRKAKQKKLGKNTGEQLKIDLGLSDYPYVMIQKIINGPVPIYIVSYDSRRSNVYLSPVRVKKSEVSQIRRIKKKGKSLLMTPFRTTPPIPIESANPIVNSGTIVVVKDLAGDIFKGKIRPQMNEGIEKSIIVLDYNLREVPS